MPTTSLTNACQAVLRRVLRLHPCQDGAISLLSVFAVMFLVMVLGMVMNAGRHVDTKIRLQNAVDAATYSASGCMARGMNATAFTNHLLCEVFALTAYFREASRRDAEKFVPEILKEWDKLGPVFQASPFLRFAALGQAIPQKTPLERELVRTFCDWAQAAGAQILPLMEYILEQELIPQYQRAVAQFWPDVAQQTMLEVAKRNGLPVGAQGDLQGVLWRTSGVPVSGSDAADSALPIVDPLVDSAYLARSKDYRRALSMFYRDRWIDRTMRFFEVKAQMSQFHRLWKILSCAYLEDLLTENSQRNLLSMLRDEGQVNNSVLERRFCYLGVVYRKKLPEILPGLFRNPADSDELAYAEGRLFVPRRRLRWMLEVTDTTEDLGGMPGAMLTIRGTRTYGGWRVRLEWAGGLQTSFAPGRIAGRDDWDLVTQNWTAQLGPAGHDTLAQILATPPVAAGVTSEVRLPKLGGLDSQTLQRISPH